MSQVELTKESLVALWEDLEKESASACCPNSRRYRRLDLNKESGIRVSLGYPGPVWELLVEVGTKNDTFSLDFPQWQGMGFESMALDVPTEGTAHIRIFLEDDSFRGIFATVCVDLTLGLEACNTNFERRKELSQFLERWSWFFERYGLTGLTQEHQRGLYGELYFLRTLLRKGIDKAIAIDSWKGSERAYHDFDLNGHIVEVKTTMTKEPRKAVISNERQLDDRGMLDLHLFVLTLAKTEGGGETLPDIIGAIRGFLPTIYIPKFEKSLREAGYLSVHEEKYSNNYLVLKEELFHVTQGFPRIITLPLGTGDLKYSILLSTCFPFFKDINTYFRGLGYDN